MQNELTEEHVLDEGLRQNPREEVSLVDISKLLKKEFRVVIIKMTKKLRKKKITEWKVRSFKQRIRKYKNNQIEMTNTIT